MEERVPNDLADMAERPRGGTSGNSRGRIGDDWAEGAESSGMPTTDFVGEVGYAERTGEVGCEVEPVMDGARDFRKPEKSGPRLARERR